MGKTIFLVEDDKNFQRFIVSILSHSGFLVETASNGRLALEVLRAQRFHPDLILCDINMPEMNGYETLRHIRADAQLANIPVIMLTSNGDSEDRAMARQLGANGYVLKRLVFSTLISEISGYLGA